MMTWIGDMALALAEGTVAAASSSRHRGVWEMSSCGREEMEMESTSVYVGDDCWGARNLVMCFAREIGKSRHNSQT